MEDSKTYNILKELKDGKDAQTATWLSHPTDYADLVASVVTAASGAGQEVSIGNTLAALANTPLYEGEPEGVMMLPAAFVSTDPADVTSYPNYLTTVLHDFAVQVTEYKANAAEEQPIIYAPPLPIDTQESRSLARCFATCRWLVSIDSYEGSAYVSDVARLNAVTDCAAMFQNCASLVSLPEAWTFNSLVIANTMFYGCSAITHLPGGFTGQNITSAPGLFFSCRKLQSLPRYFDLGSSASFSRTFYRCESLHELRPESLTFKMSRISNSQTSGEYSTDASLNSMYQMFYNIGFDNYEDETSNCITNEFTIDPTVQGYTGGIKFDLILWHNGYEKLSAESVVSLLHCLYDYKTNDPTYTNRIPSGCTNGGRAKPSVVVTVAMKNALDALFMERHGMDVSVYLGGIGWYILVV